MGLLYLYLYQTQYFIIYLTGDKFRDRLSSGHLDIKFKPGYNVEPGPVPQSV
jgi:hypothetical protein